MNFDKRTICKTLQDLFIDYENACDDGKWSLATDIHDEIRQWLRELREYKKELKEAV